MAKQMPFFFTGASAKLRINNNTVAYATDVAYSIRVKHSAPKVLGMFEAFTIEPMSYEVTGSFTIVRYARKLKEFIENNGGAAPDGVSQNGNGVGTLGPQNTKERLLSAIHPFSGEGRADQSFDPSKFHSSVMFDVEILQKAGPATDTGILAKFRDCRLTGTDFRMNKRGVATQTFTFQACYADEDSFRANMSGVGQQLV